MIEEKKTESQEGCNPECPRCLAVETRALFYKELYEQATLCPHQTRGLEKGWAIGKLCRIHCIDPWQGDKITEAEAFWGGGAYWLTPDGRKFHAKWVRVIG